jgi:iron complex outermembrane recepter protein
MRRKFKLSAFWLVPAVVAVGLNGGLLHQVQAQTASDQSAREVETVIVTGYNIRRANAESFVPVTVIDARAIEVRSALLPSELLTSLPSVTNLPENETRLGSSGARGDNANLDLRNMGATATLVLINGRRMAINPFTAGLSQAININHLPTQGIARIEVLRDGASSIYGSDAVGGVINYVLKRDFEGMEALLRLAQPEVASGESVQGALTFGTRFADDRGREPFFDMQQKPRHWPSGGVELVLVATQVGLKTAAKPNKDSYRSSAGRRA